MHYYPLTKAPKQPQVTFLPAEPKQARIIKSDTPKPRRKRFHKKKGKSPLAGK